MLMPNSPKVSIITPSYNQAQFLEETIRSVLSQDYQNIEYIVIDGGSSDGSVDIIKKYEDQIDFWVSESDSGQSDAINKGFKRATGDIVAWLNSDDVYFSDAISTAVKSFVQNKELSLFYGDCVFVDENGGFNRYFTEVESYDKKRLCSYSDFIMQPTTFFRRDKLVEVGYLDEDLHYGMDWDLWCKLCKVGDVHYERKVIAANREHGDTKTINGGWVRLVELLKINRRHMLGLWPHAFWGYVSTEIRNQGANHTNCVVRTLARLSAICVACCSPSATFYNRFLSKEKNLYGFVPYSYELSDLKAVVHLPIPHGSQKIIIDKECAHHSIVKINGIQRCVTDGEALLSSEDLLKGSVSVEFSKAEFVKRVSFFILK